jgi:hypothetical protein
VSLTLVLASCSTANCAWFDRFEEKYGNAKQDLRIVDLL